jgi:hypothetical protein
VRSLIVVTILCLTATPVFACVLDSECESGTMCLDSVCIPSLGSDQDDVPVKRPTGKTCGDDGDCSPGARCVKGSGPEGVCIGH